MTNVLFSVTFDFKKINYCWANNVLTALKNAEKNSGFHRIEQCSSDQLEQMPTSFKNGPQKRSIKKGFKPRNYPLWPSR